MIIAEVGFLLILFAGIWFVAAEIPALKASAARRIVAGVALALAVCFSSSPRTGVTSASVGTVRSGGG